MTKTGLAVIYRCVIGEVISFPKELNYLTAISNRYGKVWIGHCAGDKSHPEHLVVLKRSKKWFVLHTKTNTFKKPDGTILGDRLFERVSKLRCPVGKTFMIFEKGATTKLGIPNVDIYKCKGNFKGLGHKEHLVRIHHGSLDVKINKKEIGVLIITLESD